MKNTERSLSQLQMELWRLEGAMDVASRSNDIRRGEQLMVLARLIRNVHQEIEERFPEKPSSNGTANE